MMIYQTISRELNLTAKQVESVSVLLDQGATIPFIARYRKEATGSLDEVSIASIRDRIEGLNELNDRKTAILKSLEERDLLTQELKSAIDRTASKTELEDLYEQYRPKKKNRAMAAREKGLEPLAILLMANPKQNPDHLAAKFINDQVPTIQEALSGARDIIAQLVSDDAGVRQLTREMFTRHARITSVVKKDKQEIGQKFKDYFDWSEKAASAPSHRVLAMLRGQNEGCLTVHVLPDETQALQRIEQFFITQHPSCSGPSSTQISLAVKDGYKRLLSKSIEKETLSAIKQKADETAVNVFADNLRKLLLSAPMGQKKTLAIDPGFRTGCKVVCLDSQGKLIDHGVIYPHGSGAAQAGKTVETLVAQYGVEAVAIGNGTAGRETETFVRTLNLKGSPVITMVDESGASIYSASEAARQEFPDHDITVRGAVSIGRRLMDPLAELVKIDPKSIGVGQYQHDVDQKLLNQSLDDVVTSCVNRVGVEVNTASAELLKRVAGLNASIADNLIAWRDQNGPFKNRKELLKVPRLGPKAYEQAAGFLRIRNGAHPLDASGIHPESYAVVQQMAKDHQVNISTFMTDTALIKGMDLKPYITTAFGLPTLKDIVRELINPGRDPREQFEVFSFDDTIHGIQDLVPGLVVPGIVTNVTAFGAFVDIGVHQDGLVHISQMADRFVKDPNEVVAVRDQVRAKVLEVDVKRKRISLSLRL
ncbi:MAG: RNA-binding transcriptional accessory protein [Desulfobacteraceae bacterium]|nr:MAG: RNA-binding transcriptional accessory protein [Desulfobacteraceae bacterium]